MKRNHPQMLRIVALLIAMSISLAASAQNYYVFYGGTTYGYLYNDNGTLKSSTTLQFDKSSLWSASGELGTTNRTIQPYGSSTLYLRTSTNNGGTVSLSTNSSNWQVRSNYLCVQANNNTNYYLKVTNATTFTTASGNDGNRYYAYAVTITDIAAGLGSFEVTGENNSINASGTYNYSHTNASYISEAYTNYYFNGSDHYVSASNVSSTTLPITAVTTGYTYSLSDNAAGYATVNASTGAVSVTKIPDGGNIALTLTCTVTHNGHTATATKNIILTQTGISGTTVTLDDRENHNWSYYQPASKLPTGYPTAYISSPDPRNVKITYRGGSVSGASAVAISALDGEGQNTMVYYLTLEKTVIGMTGNYPYTVISNPFSKRPKAGSNYYGFNGWKVISGGEYINEYSDGQTMTLDATIHFVNLDNNYSPNCTSAEVVLEATWTAANVKTGSSNPGFTGGTYETNFWVLESNNNIGNITIPANVTVSASYPDGTVNFTRNLTGSITAGGNNSKLEFVNMNSTGNVNAAGYTFTMGRGIVNSGNGGTLYGVNSNMACNNTVKIESGTYSTLRNFGQGISSTNTVAQKMILGCDYDRAKGDNTKLEITGSMYVANGSINLNRTTGSLYVNVIIKSGDFVSTTDASASNYSGNGDQTYYFSVGNGTVHNPGRRFLTVEGGHLRGIAGGMDESNNQTTTVRAFDLRVRGTAQIDGVVYGAAQFAGGRGIRTMIFTGGTVNGWIAGGANGTRNDGGKLDGASYIYVGGNTIVDSKQSETMMNSASGGNVFGAGCGFANGAAAGEVTNGTNVVVADEAYVERGVYGGGGFGYCNATSNIYVLGGHVAGKSGGVTNDGYTGSGQNSKQTNNRYISTITGGVFGGACQNRGGTVNIYMNGGLVEGGVYGGSNYTGTVSGTTTLQIDGGQVGVSNDSRANIHGGGYGQSTAVSGNVSVTLGACNATSGVTVYGDVYGGSALGKVNSSTSNTTTVTLNAGTVNGAIYGGGYGPGGVAADVNGNVQVNVTGGSVRTIDGSGEDGSGSIFGCNNAGGTPRGTVKVDIYRTDIPTTGYALHAVYGGGNKVGYTGTPVVTIHGCSNSIDYVYGGGNAADVAGTNVTVYGGTIGNVYGGGNGYSETGNHTDASAPHYNPGANITSSDVNLKIYGGTITNVFGGSNEKGTINNKITVTATPNTESGTDPCSGKAFTNCPLSITALYGGGNKAEIRNSSNAYLAQPTVTINCDAEIDNLFGGAKQADYEGDIELNIDGGKFTNVFGGNDQSGVITGNVTVNVHAGQMTNVYGGNNAGGNITGKITVNIDQAASNPCSYPFSVDNVYGGGYNASYTPTTTGQNYPEVNIINGKVNNKVFGGGEGEGATIVKSNPWVTIGGTAGVVNPSGKVAAVGGSVYGGGNAASVEGSTRVQVMSGTVGDESSSANGTGNVFGGCFGVEGDAEKAKVSSDTRVEITGKSEIFGNVYGGGEKGQVGGDTKVEIKE